MASGRSGRRALASLIIGALAILGGLWWMVVREPSRRPAVRAVAGPDAGVVSRPRPLAHRSPFSGAAEVDAGELAHEPGARDGSLRRVSGVVLGRNGAPVAGAEVVHGLRIENLGGTLRGEGRLVTGSDGRFTFELENDRASRVSASHSTEGISRVERVPAGGGPLELELRLEAPAAIEGRVLHRGSAVPGARLLLGSDRLGVRPVEAVAGDDGSFRFAPVAAGPYHLSASALPPEIGDGSAWSNVPVAPAAGETARVDVELPAGIYLLVSAGELPAGELTYQVFAGAVATGAPLQELPMGRARGRAIAFRDLEPGLYTVCATVLGEPPRCVGAELSASPPLQSAEIR